MTAAQGRCGVMGPSHPTRKGFAGINLPLMRRAGPGLGRKKSLVACLAEGQGPVEWAERPFRLPGYDPKGCRRLGSWEEHGARISRGSCVPLGNTLDLSEPVSVGKQLQPSGSGQGMRDRRGVSTFETSNPGPISAVVLHPTDVS